MRIYQPGPAISPPRLSQIGILVQTLKQAPETGPSDTSPNLPVDTLERQIFRRLPAFNDSQLQIFAKGSSPTQSFQPGTVNTTQLIQALHQIGHQLDLNSVLDLHKAASELVSAIRQQYTLPPQQELKLFLQGHFGQIEIDPAQLEPTSLKAVFDSQNHQLPNTDLLAMHHQIGSLSEQIRAGFSLKSDPPLGTDWLSALQTPEFHPEVFFEHALGFNPLNLESSIQAVLTPVPRLPAPDTLAMRDRPRVTSPQAQLTFQSLTESPEPSQDNSASEKDLAEKSETLIEIANQLEATLELSPSLKSPDILALIHSFQAVVRQLDHDVSTILEQQNQTKQFKHQVLVQFAQKLQENLHFDQERRGLLQESASERLKLLVNQSLGQLQAKIWLAQENHPNPGFLTLLATLQRQA